MRKQHTPTQPVEKVQGFLSHRSSLLTRNQEILSTISELNTEFLENNNRILLLKSSKEKYQPDTREAIVTLRQRNAEIIKLLLKLDTEFVQNKESDIIIQSSYLKAS